MSDAIGAIGTGDAWLYRERAESLYAIWIRDLDIETVKLIARLAQERIAEDGFVKGMGSDDEQR